MIATGMTAIFYFYFVHNIKHWNAHFSDMQKFVLNFCNRSEQIRKLNTLFRTFNYIIFWDL